MEPSLFFSWQSDTPKQANLLRNAIRTALQEVEKRTGIVYKFDESTRDLPGSPDIKHAVLAKIELASIFVADVTIVSGTYDNKAKGQSNSNVMFELGYATAILGVDRIIKIAAPPMDTLPFDIRGNRITMLDHKITQHLTNAVAAIGKHDPPTVFERRVAEPALRRNERANVEGYFSNLPLTLFSDSLQRLPRMFSRILDDVCDDLYARRQRSDKRLPDDLQSDFDAFLGALNTLTQLGSSSYLETSSSLIRLPKNHENPNADQIMKQAARLKQDLEATLNTFILSSRRQFPDIEYDEILLQAERTYARKV